MGIVVNTSDPGIDMLLYGNKNHMVANYVSAQLQNMGTVFNEFGSKMYANLQNSYNFLTDKLAQYNIMSQLSTQGANIANNQYESLYSFSALQTANITMQRWVMAHPEVKKLYLDQNLDGYSETYKNVFGNTVGEADYNYRRVMDNVLVDTEDGFVVRTYNEDLIPGDVELDRYEKLTILNTYDAIDWFLDTCKFDFTVTDDGVKINK